ncbi:MAG: 23S rRNA (adenine(2503)-C(2))-methyltransferase RlmN [Lachnospiraceae bacterium]|nr:23S rRNA (adenine(2503)-C(2))-methyltransferase RlmN [Lachnospiraceae bacterium]
MKKDLRSLTEAELKEELKSMGEPAYRASQLFRWLHVELAEDPSDMTNLPKALREKLAQEYVISSCGIRDKQCSKLDGTVKYLFEMPDGDLCEAVRMSYHHGISVCISSQIGCRMGCSFCASTLAGLKRSLTAGEMLSEVYAVTKDGGERVSNLVIMGMGEPLDNYDNVVRFIRLLSDDKGYDLGIRGITLSTCGLVPGIRALAEEGLGITLALSLHAATDEKRQEIMPVAKSYSLAELMEACDFYFDKTGRRISFEYALIKGSNDGDEDVRALARLAAPRKVHVNLIPVNPVTERGHKRPERAAVESFRERLEKLGVNATIRRELGSDIDGACGQLRQRHL